MAMQSVTASGGGTRDGGGRKGAWRTSFADGLVGVPLNALNAYVCFSIMAAFPKKTPSAEELSDRFDMSRATAYRYRAALMAVRGEA